MANRLNAAHSKLVRERIQTAQLVRRLEDHVLKNLDMTRTQVFAAIALLKKTLPDLQALDLSGSVEARVTVSVVDEQL